MLQQQLPQQQQSFGQGQRQQQQTSNDDCDCNCCEGDCNCCDGGCDECGCDGLKHLNLGVDCSCPECCGCLSSGDILSELSFKNHHQMVDEDESEQLVASFKRMIVLYSVHKKIVHTHFGECLVLKSETESPRRIILKNIWFTNMKEYQKQLRFWQTLVIQEQHQSLVQVYALYAHRISDICVDRWRITLLLEKAHPMKQPPPLPLLLFQLGSALKFLHQQNSSSYFHKDRMYEVGPREVRFLPPYLDFLSSNSPTQTQIDSAQDYDKVDIQLLAEWVVTLLYGEVTRVPQEYQKLIRSMLEPDPSNRIDCEELINKVKQKTSYNSPKQQIQQNISEFPQIQMYSPVMLSPITKDVECEPQVDGGTYTGAKLKGRKHGYGRLTYTDGAGYEGEWRNDRQDGQGKRYRSGGVLEYEGGFLNGALSGMGYLHNITQQPHTESLDYHHIKLFKTHWDYYRGEFKDDLWNGYGILYLVNGEKWSGEFSNGVPNGSGTFHQLLQQITGTWKNGEFIK